MAAMAAISSNNIKHRQVINEHPLTQQSRISGTQPPTSIWKPLPLPLLLPNHHILMAHAWNQQNWPVNN